MADLAYSMLADLVERRATTDRLVTGFAAVMGGSVDITDPQDALDKFDAALIAPPEDTDTDRHALMTELGLRA